jgi:3-oxoacyl-[acyl-carrier protein] reductase
MDRDVCVVTGAGGGLGAEVARRTAASGRLVVVADADGGAAREVADEVDGVAVVVDLCEPDQVRRVISEATAHGRLRLLVNCAGAWSPSAQFPSGEDWRRTLALDLETPMLATQLCLEPMRHAGGGAVVNVSSSAALGDSSYGSPEYAAGKAGLIRFTTAVTGLAATHGVRVSCVVPHWIGLPRAYDEWSRLTPAEQARSGGLVPTREVVDTILGLADDPASAGRVLELTGSLAP